MHEKCESFRIDSRICSANATPLLFSLRHDETWYLQIDTDSILDKFSITNLTGTCPVEGAT